MFRAALVRRSNMYAVGRFISQGVYTVSGPFHPFGGAVDIIVVQQQDGSYKSSPWYVKFGKFQGVLKRSEKVVNIAVNDEALKFHMFLDSTGEAYFLKDAEPDEGSSSQRAITSGDEVLLLEDGPSKSEDGLESKAAEEDVEKGESSDEKDSNLALRFEGRKASYLLVQQAAEAQSAEARAAKELKIAEVRNGEANDEAELPESSLLKKITDIEGDAEFSESNTLKEDTYITREAELPGSSTLKEEKDTVGEAELPGSSILKEEKDIVGETEVPGSIILKEEKDIVGETEVPGSSILKEERDIVGETEVPGSSILKEEKDIVGETELPGSSILKEEKDIVGEIGLPASVTLKEEKDIVGEAELPGSSTLKEEKDIVGEAELPGSITLKEEVDIVGVASNDLLSSLAALKSKNTCLEELENATGGSAIHSLLNRSVGLEESQQVGRPSCSLLAQAALGAVSKAAWEAGSEDSAKILGNGCRESLEIVNNSGEVIAEGFRLRRSKSLSLGSEQVADELVQVRRIRSESDLRLLETDLEGISSAGDLRLSRIKDTSPEPSTLTITSADGVVVLHTPRRGSPPPLIPQEDLTQTLQQPIILEGDGSEKPLVLGMVAFEQVTDNTQGDTPVEKPDPSPAKKEVGALITASGGWNLWPFPLRRPRNPEINGSAPVLSREALIVAGKAAVDSALVNNLVSERDYYLRSRKNKVRSFLPTSQMLSTMNLKEGSNRITFTFYTRVLGRQQVDARIYLWKWNTRVVISDVDGTITKSDVLGQVMPLVGRDWTQSGVTRLFSAIKENGYEVMFLSARAISQAYLTRQFLLNLKQDGEALPDGPVVISPDGLFPSLYREVIRRAPHEFKIACLQDIRDLFPEDCNPFYAGFGNRDTDEISYLKVGIPKGKIFIINPKGEVAVNNRVDVKSYTSLHKLVDDMFPPQTSTEQEDFNSWNYWKMPLPDIEDELSVKSASKPKKTKS